MRNASGTKSTSSISLAAMAILMHGLARIGASITHELRNSVFARAGQRIGRSITATSFSHLHSLELAFHTTSRTGALTRVIDRGTRSVMTIFRAFLFSFFPSFFELALVCTVLFTRFSSAYVLIVMLTFLAFSLWTFSINDKMSEIRAEMNATENEASAKLTDSLINIEAVKLFDNSHLETKRYDISLSQYEKIAIRNERLYASLNIGQTCVYTLGLTALLLLATRDIAVGTLTVGSLVLLTTMLQRLWVPLDFLGWQYREVKQSLIDMQNLFDMLRRQSTIQDSDNANTLEVTHGNIEFENVSFVYPDNENDLSFTRKGAQRTTLSGKALIKNDDGDEGNGAAHATSSLQKPPAKRTRRRVALDNLSFSVPAGSSVALVGASGSGKSTATRLMARLYDVTSGRILIDGQDISNVTQSSLRMGVSIVPQVCFISLSSLSFFLCFFMAVMSFHCKY